MKICQTCKQNLPLSRYYSNKHKKFKDGLARECIDCDKSRNLKYSYGIDLATYNAKLVEQNGLCAICQHPETTKIKGKLISLAVDHSHADNKVRGLLCVKCNRAFGMLRENKEILHGMLKYLDKYDKPKAS